MVWLVSNEGLKMRDKNAHNWSYLCITKRILTKGAHSKHKLWATSVDTNLATYSETCIVRKWKMGASGTTTSRLKTKSLNWCENRPIIPAHMRNNPSCARDMLLLMISSLYYTKDILFFICLLEGLGIILILILNLFLPWIYSS